MMLLDTCALLWLASAQEKLTDQTLKVIDTAPAVYVSAISAFEIGIKSQVGKLRLPVPARQWFDAIVEHHDLTVIDLDVTVCIRATELPPIHRDPCDRFIIATALERDLSIVTTDKRFKEYGVEVLI